MADRDPHNIRYFAWTSFFNDASTEMAYWILPAFLTSIGGGPAQLGIIEGIAEAVASFAKLASGYLTDRIHRRKPIVAAGYFVANAVKPLLALSTSWIHILFIRFADRLSKGLRGVPRDIMLADAAKHERLGAAYGFVQAADSAGAIAGPLIAWILLRHLHLSMRGVFLAAAVPGTLCVLTVTLLVRESSSKAAPLSSSAAQPKQSLSKTPLPRAFWIILTIVVVFSLGGSSDMFLVLRAKEAGIAVAFAPLLGLVFNSVYTAACYPAGALSDRVPRHRIAALGYAIYAITYAVFAFAPLLFPGERARIALWLAMALYGLFYALTEPVLKALVVSSVGKDARGRAVGIYSFAVSLCLLLSSAATGWLWHLHGAQLPFAISAALAFLAALLLLIFASPKDLALTRATPTAP